MAKSQHPQTVLSSPPLMQGAVTMPWDLDRYIGRNAKPPSGIILPILENKSNPCLPSHLLMIPQDILELILDLTTKRDAFRLAQTCKTFFWHPAVLKAVLHEPISIAEVGLWYQQLPDCGMDTTMMIGPPVTWGINACTGPLVRRMAIPEWVSEQDIQYLVANCPNLHAIDFTEVFDSEPHAMGWPDSDSDWNTHEGQDAIDFWPSMLDRCPALFKNLRSIHLPYGSWRTVNSRRHSYQHARSACLPKTLHVADHLQSLEITCQQESRLDHPSPEARRKASAKLLAEILRTVTRGLTTLGLYNSESTIDNLDGFLQSLAVFPRLRTIKLSLHRDLKIYQKDFQPLYELDLITEPILSNTTGEYEQDIASDLQYLSNLKKINDRGRFSLVSSDHGEDYLSMPHDYYGLCHTKVVHGPRDDLWVPVWTWNDRLNWVRSHHEHPSTEIIDTGKCRALFEELGKAQIPVSIRLGPCHTSSGSLFADRLDREVSHRRSGERNFPPLPSNGATVPNSHGLGQQPKQHFIRQRILIATSLNDPSLYYSMPSGIDCQPFPLVSVDFASIADQQKYGDDKGSRGLCPTASAAWDFPMHKSLQEELRRNSDKSGAKPLYCAKDEIPDPIWRLNEIGDLVDDLRLVWDRGFAYTYTRSFGKDCHPNPDWAEWSKLIHTCKMYLRDRLWREAEYTALLFRRIPVDFPRLTRLVLYIPAALYPDHDQTFIKHALPGTGWTVKHYGSVRDEPPVWSPDETCLKLADDICPFIRRIFTRPAPTDDPAAVIVHHDGWHVTKRPLFDLDNEYKSMNQLLTEPLWRNYTEGNDWRRMWDPQIADND